MVMRRLIVFTSAFPYPAKSMETYLETECQYYGRFDEVILFSLGVRKNTLDKCRKLRASNIRVIPILFAPEWRYVLNVYSAFMDGNFYREIKKLAQEKRLNIRRIVRLLIYLSRSHYEANLVRSELKKIQLEDSENIVYIYRFEYHPYVPILLKNELGNCKMVARAHRYDLYEERNSDGYIPLRDVLLRELNKVCLISEDGRKYLAKKFPEYSEKLIVSRLGTNDYGLGVDQKRERFRIVSCSNVVPVKRVNRIVDVLAELTDEIEWTHFGAGEGFQNLKKYASKLPSNIRCQFRGQIGNEELMKEYKQGNYNLFINLSESEGVPVSIMEAMSFGIPCIATNVGGTGEIVEDEVNGYLLPGDFESNDVAKKIRKFLTMSNLEYESFCIEARMTWNDKYNAERNYTGFADMLYGTMNTRS